MLKYRKYILEEGMSLEIIAHMENEFKEKFGIPRQSGLADTLSKVVFEPEFAVPEAFRGIEGYSHLWILWIFSESKTNGFSPTVRPPRLGGNKRVGVFATRSPFRPNPIGLSSVRLERFCLENGAPVLYVRGADIMNGTPIIDIKPYIAYTDSHPDALGGFSQQNARLSVVFPENISISPEKRNELEQILSQDPRPQYQNDPDRIYYMDFGEMRIAFSVSDSVLTVKDVDIM